MRIRNITSQKEKRRKLRKNLTPVERKLWYKLNRNQLGLRFFRQYGIGDYVVDFCCPKKKFIVEVDGDVHGFEERQLIDKEREDFLKRLGYKILRFTNSNVKENIYAVVEEIYRSIKPPLNSPLLLRGNERGLRNQREVSANKGIVLIVALLALLVAAIFLPALIFVVNNETKWSVKQKKTSIAFQMAEAGLDHGVWKLSESDWFFTIFSTGGEINNYKFDKVYVATGTDGTLGEYKIKISSSPYKGTNDAVTVLIEARGRDKSTDEVRALQAVYERKLPANNALTAAGGVKYENTFVIHWGPALSYTEINLQGTQTSKYWPKKVSKGKIDPWDTNPNPPNEEITNFPPDKNYEAYKTDLGSPPGIDLDTYRDLAKKSRIPKPNGQNATWDETSSKKKTDKIKESDWSFDFNGDGDTSDQISMEDIYYACGPASGTVAGAGVPAASTTRTTCTASGWYKYFSLYHNTNVCNPFSSCGNNDQAFYLDINGTMNGSAGLKHYSDTCARPVGIMGAGDNGGQSATYQGTGYFNGTNEVIFKDYYLDCSTCVIFIEGDPGNTTKNIFKLEDQSCSRTFIHVEAFVTGLGDGHVHAKGIANYTVQVPTGVWKQYVAGTVDAGTTPDSSAIREYPADNGLNTSSPTWTLPDSEFDGNATGVVFHGFLSPYTFSCGGGDNIVVGSIYGRKEGTKEVSLSSFYIYYDSATATNIRYSDPGVQRVSWREIKTDW